MATKTWPVLAVAWLGWLGAYVYIGRQINEFSLFEALGSALVDWLIPLILIWAIYLRRHDETIDRLVRLTWGVGAAVFALSMVGFLHGG